MTQESQRKRALAGHMYNDLADELVQARQRAVLLTGEYNASYGQPAAAQETILRRLLRHVGSVAFFEPDLRCEFGYNITVGGGVNINQGVVHRSAPLTDGGR